MGRSLVKDKTSALSNKKLYLEVLRIIACFFVIFNHTGNEGFFLFSLYPTTSIQFLLYCFISIFCKLSVPIFYAISGALLLGKEEPIKTIFTKRITKICVILLLSSLGYYIYNNNFDFSQLSFSGFFRKFYSQDHRVHLWYLYAFIPFLMSLPFLRAMVRGLENKYFLYMAICILFFSAIVPLVEFFLWKGGLSLNSHFRINWLAQQAVLYPCIGYYLENRMDASKAKKWVLPLIITNIVTIGICCIATAYRASIMGVCTEGVSQYFHNAFSIITVISIYITAKCWFNADKAPTFIKRIILSVGECTFGMYIIHVAVMRTLDKTNTLSFIREKIVGNYMVSCLLYCLIVMVLCYIITFFAKFLWSLLKRSMRMK